MAVNPSTLWMGDLQPHMDENFVMGAFHQMGENVVTLKIIRDRLSGESKSENTARKSTQNSSRHDLEPLKIEKEISKAFEVPAIFKAQKKQGNRSTDGVAEYKQETSASSNIKDSCTMNYTGLYSKDEVKSGFARNICNFVDKDCLRNHKNPSKSDGYDDFTKKIASAFQIHDEKNSPKCSNNASRSSVDKTCRRNSKKLNKDCNSLIDCNNEPNIETREQDAQNISQNPRDKLGCNQPAFSLVDNSYCSDSSNANSEAEDLEDYVVHFGCDKQKQGNSKFNKIPSQTSRKRDVIKDSNSKMTKIKNTSLSPDCYNTKMLMKPRSVQQDNSIQAKTFSEENASQVFAKIPTINRTEINTGSNKLRSDAVNVDAYTAYHCFSLDNNSIKPIHQQLGIGQTVGSESQIHLPKSCVTNYVNSSEHMSKANENISDIKNKPTRLINEEKCNSDAADQIIDFQPSQLNPYWTNIISRKQCGDTKNNCDGNSSELLEPKNICNSNRSELLEPKNPISNTVSDACSKTNQASLFTVDKDFNCDSDVHSNASAENIKSTSCASDTNHVSNEALTNGTASESTHVNQSQFDSQCGTDEISTPECAEAIELKSPSKSGGISFGLNVKKPVLKLLPNSLLKFVKKDKSSPSKDNIDQLANNASDTSQKDTLQAGTCKTANLINSDNITCPLEEYGFNKTDNTSLSVANSENDFTASGVDIMMKNQTANNKSHKGQDNQLIKRTDSTSSSSSSSSNSSNDSDSSDSERSSVEKTSSLDFVVDFNTNGISASDFDKKLKNKGAKVQNRLATKSRSRSKSRDKTRISKNKYGTKSRSRSRSKSINRSRTRSRSKVSYSRSRGKKDSRSCQKHYRSRSRDRYRRSKSRFRSRTRSRSRHRTKDSLRSKLREKDIKRGSRYRKRSRSKSYSKSRSKSRENRKRSRRNSYILTRKTGDTNKQISNKIKDSKNISVTTGKPIISKKFQDIADKIKSTNGARNIVVDDLGPINTSAPAGYCFVEFEDEASAHNAMLRLNGKGIPGSQPHKLFKLNHASFGREHLLVPEYSLYVGDLTKDVDDLALYRVFGSRYKSVRAAKVVLDSNGENKGFGFVRFRSEAEQQLALIEMQNFKKLGQKPIKVSLAVPKKMKSLMQPQPVPHSFQQQQTGSGYNSQYMQQYNQVPPPYYNSSSAAGSSHASWWQQQPYSYYTGYGQYGDGSNTWANSSTYGYDYTQTEDPYGDETLEDPEIEIDVEKANKEFMERSEELYMALEGSRWHPLDNIFSTITPQLTDKS